MILLDKGSLILFKCTKIVLVIVLCIYNNNGLYKCVYDY